MTRLLVLLALLTLPFPARAQAPSVPERLREAVRVFDHLVTELGLPRVPATFPDAAALTASLDRLGEDLEALSRQGMTADTLTPEELTALDTSLTAFETSLATLRAQSLRLRVYTFWKANGYKDPKWGLALGPDATAPAAKDLRLTAHPGDQIEATFLVVPITRDLKSLHVTASALKPKHLPLQVSPTDRLDLPKDSTQPYIISLQLPPDLPLGDYKATLTIRPTALSSLTLNLLLTVQ